MFSPQIRQLLDQSDSSLTLLHPSVVLKSLLCNPDLTKALPCSPPPTSHQQ